MRCRAHAGDQRAPACATVTVQSDHAPADQVGRYTLDDAIDAMPTYWAGYLIAYPSDAEPADEMGAGCGDDLATMRSKVAQANYR